MIVNRQIGVLGYAIVRQTRNKSCCGMLEFRAAAEPRLLFKTTVAGRFGLALLQPWIFWF